MKSLLRNVAFYLLALWVAQELLQPSFTIGPFRMLVITAVALSVVHLILVPVMKLILMPVYGLTFGLFGIVVNAAILYGVIYFVAPGAVLGAWTFPGLVTPYASLPQTSVPLIGTVVVAALVVTVVTKTLDFLIE